MEIIVFQPRGVVLSTAFLFFLTSFIKHGEGLQTVNCNVENSSTLLLPCRSNEQIFINSIFYHQPVTECGGTGSCKKRYRTDDPNFSPICQYVYGDCNQPLNSTVLDYCRKDNLTVAAEVDYDCRIKQSAQGIYSAQQNGSNTSPWIAYISCPPQTFIYIESVVYWKLNYDSTCQSKTWTIAGEELRLNNLCIKQQQCQPSLLYNISTLDGCQPEWPNLGAEVNYRCIEEAVDICSYIVRISNDSLTTSYITSPTSTMPSSCNCQVNGNEMEVKVLYLHFTAMTSVRGDLYFTPAPVSLLNLTTPIFNTRIFSNISKVTVTFDDRNPTQQNFLLEFKELKNYSFLQLNCCNSENNMPMSCMFTYTTVRYGELQETQEHNNKLAIISGAASAGMLMMFIIIIIILIRLLKRNKKREQSIISKTTQNLPPVYFVLEDYQNNGETNDEEDGPNSHNELNMEFDGVQNPSRVSDSHHVLTGNTSPNSVDNLLPANSQQRVHDVEVLENELYVPLELSHCTTEKNIIDSHVQLDHYEKNEKTGKDSKVVLEITAGDPALLHLACDVEILENPHNIKLKHTLYDQPLIKESSTFDRNCNSVFEIMENDQYVSFDGTKAKCTQQTASIIRDNDTEIMENELYVPYELDTE